LGVFCVFVANLIRKKEISRKKAFFGPAELWHLLNLYLALPRNVLRKILRQG